MTIGSRKNEYIENIQIFLQFVVQVVTLTFFRVFFVLDIQGEKEALEEVKKAQAAEKGILFAANHISEWDAIMVRCALPFKALVHPMYYVAMTREHYQNDKFGWRKHFYGGTLFKMLGAYPAYLGMRDYQASLVNHIELLEYGKSICIFPEGKISVNTAKPSEAKGGIGFLAEYTKTNIIPVTLAGFEKVTVKVIIRGMFGKRRKVSVIYGNLIDINTLLEDAKVQHIVAGIDTNKYVSERIMQTIYRKNTTA